MKHCCLIFVLLAILAGSKVATAGGLTDRTWVRDGEVVLSSGEGGTLVHLGTRAPAPVELQKGELLYGIRESRNGWIAVGSRQTETGYDIFLIEDSDGRQLRRPTPGGWDAIRGGATPIVVDDEWVGLVWLEGNDPSGLGVFAADWDGKEWRNIQVVSPPLQGDQVALRAEVLADGSWLLVWTHFDGEDDDIVWSRRIGSEWSAPERVTEDNPVPDITPALIASGDGAHLAWDWFDGSQYRLRRALFDGSSWRMVESRGPQGGLYPTFSRIENTTVLLYWQVHNREWELRELDGSGRIQRQAKVPGMASQQRPIILQDIRGGMTLRWENSGEPDGRPDAAVEWDATR